MAEPENFSTVELAERWGMSPGTLVNWRVFKRGPTYKKVGTRVRYALADVKAYELKYEIRAHPQRQARQRFARRGARRPIAP